MTQLDMVLFFLGYIAVVSVAAERFVEMCKPVFGLPTFVKWFGVLTDDTKKVWYYVLAAVAGGTLHLISDVDVPYFGDVYSAALLVGMLASGGSGMWHELLAIVRNFSQTVPPAK